MPDKTATTNETADAKVVNDALVVPTEKKGWSFSLKTAACVLGGLVAGAGATYLFLNHGEATAETAAELVKAVS